MRRLVLLLLLVLLSGCAGIGYIRIGPQKMKRVIVILEEQEADPNVPGVCCVLSLNFTTGELIFFQEGPAIPSIAERRGCNAQIIEYCSP